MSKREKYHKRVSQVKSVVLGLVFVVFWVVRGKNEEMMRDAFIHFQRETHSGTHTDWFSGEKEAE